MLANILWFLAIGGIFYFMMRGGGCCGGHDHGSHNEKNDGDHNHHGSSSDPKRLADTSSREQTDPVCGMNVSSDSLESEHAGQYYHFCSEQCRKLFDLHPNKYA